jgi:hypothetical protein
MAFGDWRKQWRMLLRGLINSDHHSV